MVKFLLTAALLATSLTANSAVVLQSGDTFFSSFTLLSEGDQFKETDFYWDVGALINFAAAPVEVTFTAYEDIAGTQEVFSSAFFDLGSGIRSYLGGNQDLFSDLSGSFSITNTGTNSIELVDVIVSNFAGTIEPSNVATATITPSAVPLPAAGWLFLSALMGLVGFGRTRAIS